MIIYFLGIFCFYLFTVSSVFSKFYLLSSEQRCTLPTFPKKNKTKQNLKQPSIICQAACNSYKIFDGLSNNHFKEILCFSIIFVLSPIVHINRLSKDELY